MQERGGVARKRVGMFEDAPCDCGGVGCGGRISPVNTVGLSPGKIRRRRWRQHVCNACRMRFCTAHYDALGVNIPAPTCPARLKYNLARAFAKSA